MKLFIPTIGTRIKLAKDWTFMCWKHESRNIDFAKGRNLNVYENYHDFPSSAKDNDKYWKWTKATEPITLKNGTILVVDRIYIRQQAKDFDSVTFKIEGEKGKGFGGANRFWAKLDDVNKIEGEILKIKGPKPLKLNATIKKDALGLYVKAKGNTSRILRPLHMIKETRFKEGDRVNARAWTHGGAVQTADRTVKETWDNGRIGYTWTYNLLEKKLGKKFDGILVALEDIECSFGRNIYFSKNVFPQGPKHACEAYKKAAKIIHNHDYYGKPNKELCDCALCNERISWGRIAAGIANIASAMEYQKLGEKLAGKQVSGLQQIYNILSTDVKDLMDEK